MGGRFTEPLESCAPERAHVPVTIRQQETPMRVGKFFVSFIRVYVDRKARSSSGNHCWYLTNANLLESGDHEFTLMVP